MYSTLSSRARSATLALALAFQVSAAVPSADAQDPRRDPTPRARSTPDLVIKDGTFEHKGQRVPATLRNVIDAILERFPRTNVTIVGADNARIGDLTLRWSASALDPSQPAGRPLHAAFAALKAASQPRFSIESFDNDFVLAAQDGGAGTLIAEVFKIGALVSPRSIEASRLEVLENRFAAQSKQYTSDHPTMKELAERLKEQRARAAAAPPPTGKVLQEIQEIVSTTLEQLNPGATRPNFKYHAGTGLLVVIGTEKAIDVTRKVIAALQP